MRGIPLALALTCALLTAVPYTARLSLLTTRTFDPDEFQHLHAAWSVQQGQLPFRDFFEHHMPGIYYLLGPVLRSYDIVGSADGTINAIFAARAVMFVCAIAIALFTFLLGWRYGGAPVAFVATALLSTNIVFVSRSLEIRPDVPAVACWIASQYALFIALSPATGDDSSRRGLFALSGLLLGATLTFTQKALLAGPGFALFSFLYLTQRSTADRPTRFVDLVSLVVAAMVPLAAVAAHYSVNGALPSLITGVWTNNLGWIQEVTPATTLHWMLLRDPFFCALAVAGYVLAGTGLRVDGTSSKAAALFLPTLSLLVGMAVMPAPFPQYLLLVLPASAVYGADFLWRGLALAADKTGSDGRDARLFSGAALVFGVVATVGVAFARPFFRHPAVYPGLAIAALALTAVLVARRRPSVAAVVLLGAMSVYSLQQLTWMAGLSNADALAMMRFIHGSTTSTSRVLDGFSGYGWFRPHAAFHWFTAPGVRPRLTAADKAEMAAMVAGCAPHPEIVILDEHLRKVSADIAPLVARHFNRTAFELVWMRDPARDSCTAGFNKSNQRR